MLAAVHVPWSAQAADEDEQAVLALEKRCEEAREARLKPLREAEIAKCKANKRNDPDYCERFWRDYGNPVRLPNGRMSPRLLDDLPECVAAYRARRALAFK
ncbi:MAG: hypothetical protein DIU71_00670 [Proteobacteria bacterium]|nr:MAG: hypothetical protein DIU71_00670 [Pseudomonadota bacterium]